MSLDEVVAQNIRMLRVRRLLSQEGLAMRCGFSVSYISMLERRRRRPTLETLDVLAQALGVSPAYLLQEPA